MNETILIIEATSGFGQASGKQCSNNLRADLLRSNIQITKIEPERADTGFSNICFHGDQDKAEKVYQGTTPLTGTDIAEIVYWVTTVPQHVNINALEVMPVWQSWAPFAIHRTTKS